MTRKITLAISLVLLAGLSLLQAQNLGTYTFSTGIDATKWIPITNTTSILTSGSSLSSMRSQVLDIGFPFTFGAEAYTKFSVNSDGNLRFGSTVTGYNYYSNPFNANGSNNNNPKINFFGCDGNIADSGYVYKQLVGVEPERILVLEFCTSTSSSSATYGTMYRWQVQLFEGSNNIQIVYPSSVPSAGPSVTRQQGMCVNSSDIWLVKANNTATPTDTISFLRLTSPATSRKRSTSMPLPPTLLWRVGTIPAMLPALSSIGPLPPLNLLPPLRRCLPPLTPSSMSPTCNPAPPITCMCVLIAAMGRAIGKRLPFPPIVPD